MKTNIRDGKFFVTLSFGEIELKQFSPLLFQRWLSLQYKDYPEPPKKVAKIGRTETLIENPNDEHYKAKVQRFMERMDEKQTEFLIRHGVASMPPKDFTMEWHDYDLDPTNEGDRKLGWIYSELKSTQDINDLVTALSGLIMPEENEVALEADVFRSDGEQPSNNGVPVQKQIETTN